MEDPNELQIDFMFLADKAEALNGKLYVMGGGWDRIFMPQLPGPLPIPISVAISILVPWNLTNRRFKFVLELTDADGNRVALTPEQDVFTVDFEVGRPPGLTPGTPQRTVLTLTLNPGLQFEKEGRYSFHGTIDGAELKRVNFDLMPIGSLPNSPAA
ncbi:MAG: DUF6941 family protein [Solirubrobacterales bacterium]